MAFIDALTYQWHNLNIAQGLLIFNAWCLASKGSDGPQVPVHRHLCVCAHECACVCVCGSNGGIRARACVCMYVH
jgi:hypothetical protein